MATGVSDLADITRMCQATNRQGNPCGNRAIAGGRVCRMHGGASPQVMAKAAERLSLLRDLAAEVLFERIGAEQATIDPKVLLDTVVKLGAQVELLEGRATGRTESTVKTEERAAVIREQLTATIDDLAAKRAQRGAGDVSEAVDA